MISYIAPSLCQGSDEDVLVVMGDIMFPGFIKRAQTGEGLRLWVDGVTPTDQTRADADYRFRVVLGALRAWRTSAGELREEAQSGLRHTSASDEAGNQWIFPGSVLVHAIVGCEVERFAKLARAAIDNSPYLEQALWLNGRSNRSAPDYYMVHEYGCLRFGGEDKMSRAVGVSLNDQERLRQSANNMSPLEGGRHAMYTGPKPWDLERQRDFIAALLRAWIEQAAR